MDCSICCFEMNGSSRKPIECPKCQEKTCVTCVKKFMDSSLEDPHCMHCKHQWDLFFVNKVLPRTYMSLGWKSIRSALLFNRERSFFPDTIPLVAREIEKEKIKEQIKQIEEKERALKRNKVVLFNRLHNVDLRAEPPKEKGLFNIRQCPTANCKGFLDNGHCILCKKNSCLQCNVNKVEGEEHQCLPENVDTWRMIASSSKPCPNCATRIQKTEGCAQMWCPGCHVAFNWQTGQMERGAIHNPHYYEWAARIGIQNLAPRQGNHCDQERIWRLAYYPPEIRLNVEFQKIHQRLNHIINWEAQTYRDKLAKDNTDLRILFLRNKINEDYYKKTLIKREIQRQKDVRISELLDTVRQVMVPFFQQAMAKEITVTEIITQTKNLERFLDDSIEELNTTFKSQIGDIKIR